MCKIFLKDKLIFFILVFVFSFLFINLSPLEVLAKGGIAISGSFYRHHFRMVPGEEFQSPNVNIVIFNNYDNDITVNFRKNLPKGAQIRNLDSNIKIPANQSIKLPVVLSLDENVVPGTYQISVSAEVIPDNATGITILSSAELISNLTVFGEAGKVKINTVTKEGQSFISEINLFYKDGENLLPAGYALGNVLEERLIPGNYSVQAYYSGKEIANQSFQVVANDTKNIVLPVQTSFVEYFKVNSQYSEGTKNIVSSGVTYSIKNIYERLQDARIILKVYYAKTKDELKTSLQKAPIEEIELLSLPFLEVGNQSGRGSYIPVDGWKNGIYKLMIELHSKGNSLQKDVLYASSEEIDINVQKSNFLLYLTIIILLIVIPQIVWYLISGKRGNDSETNQEKD